MSDSIQQIINYIVVASFGYFVYYLQHRLKEKSQSKAELELQKRDSFVKLLDQHSNLILNKYGKPFEQWVEEFSAMSKSILMWASDDVLAEYGKYVESFEKEPKLIEDRELYFAKAILAFRRELGYKNRKQKITLRQIVLIFRSGQQETI